MIPNLGNEAISVGDFQVIVWTGTNSGVSILVTVEAPDGGSTPDNLAAPKTLAGEVLSEL
jgi:hypothetical protein